MHSVAKNQAPGMNACSNIVTATYTTVQLQYCLLLHWVVIDDGPSLEAEDNWYKVHGHSDFIDVVAERDDTMPAATPFVNGLAQSYSLHIEKTMNGTKEHLTRMYVPHKEGQGRVFESL